eukprot:762609-Prymnesium_polylepis.2
MRWAPGAASHLVPPHRVDAHVVAGVVLEIVGGECLRRDSRGARGTRLDRWGECPGAAGWLHLCIRTP